MIPALPISRRGFLRGLGATTAATMLPRLAQAGNNTFEPDFLWGVATSAPETESRANRGRSNWDVFIDNIGGSKDGTTNVRNTEFDTRYLDEFKLLQAAGVKAFRFSFAWPRIQPETPGAPNVRGLDHYDRMIDAMLEHGLEPIPTLFHWDIPLWAGDFLDRDISRRMADYAEIMARMVGDRAKTWLVFNEPGVIPIFGYGQGAFAPGYRSRHYMGAALHHVNLAHGRALTAIRANTASGTRISSAFNIMPFEAPSGNDEDIQAARFVDVLWNDAVPGPAYGRDYPSLALPLVESYIQDGDMQAIAVQPDFFGLNFYSRSFVKADPNSPLGIALVEPPAELERTDELPYDPDTYTKVLLKAHKDYNAPDIIATEFGFPVAEEAPKDGWVNDPLRIKYMRGYIQAAQAAYQQGVKLKGMFYWSSTDNWEWVLGLSKHFGLIHIEQPSLTRIPKRSLEYYAHCIRLNAPA
ncbi:MAG: family 1 glycosylhydrolase [Burkholderiaceae bacterium]